MDRERERQIDRVLREALELGGTDRGAFLDEACAGDAELRDAVEAQLGVESSAGWAAGRVVGPYRIEALLGKGGMGKVYRARDERLGRVVAIKMVLAGGDAAREWRFTREARVASALNHPNIVTVYDMGREDGVPYLVTEYVDGDPLRVRMSRGMGVEEAVEVARQVASALSAAHGAGIVHRDIKPENVLVRRDGLVKVVDFGIAKLMEGTRISGANLVTDPGTLVGTAGYMAPEQVQGEEVDGRTDVWGLGVMLYEMVAGHRPFRGPTRWDVLVAVVSQEPKWAAIPGPLVEVIDRALRKPPGERFATAGEMAAALDALKGRLGGAEATDEREEATAPYEVRTDDLTDLTTNLPQEREPLIGREREMRAIVDELRRTRLVTVTGPGGIGKTRLATDAGRALLAEFEDGVYFVDLAAIRDPALVASAVAQVLGVKEVVGAPLEETLATFVGERELLLVLDNFEQVADAAPLVARLLASAPRLKALVTSRERLRVSAEREFPLSPLALPPSDRDVTGEELSSYGSVALLAERARAVRSGFALDALSEGNRRAVAEICHRLDGLPLAIELAAARLRILMPEALLARLDKQSMLPTGGAQDLPERQRTMRATIAWSYDLLADDERRLFERLSVFSGGWTLEATEALAPDLDVLDLLAQLADKSLVLVEHRGEAVRYRMLETIRQYAGEKLAETGGEARVRAAHAAWFLEFAETAAPGLLGPAVVRSLALLDRELENVRAALEWGAEESPESLLRLSVAMAPFWSMRGRRSEGRSWLERALAAERPPSPARAEALYWAGLMARMQGDYDVTRELLEESLATGREVGDRTAIARALVETVMLGGFQLNLHLDPETTEAMLQEARGLYEDLGDDRGRADVNNAVAARAYTRQDFDTYTTLVEESLEIYRKLDDRRLIATSLFRLGIIAEPRGEYARATELFEESLEIARELGDRSLAARATHFLGNVAGRKGDYARAAALRAEASREYLAIGDRFMITALFEDVVPEALARGMAERAARLMGALLRLEETGDLPGDVWEAPLLASVREALGDGEAEAAMAKGRRLSLDQALGLAFDD